MKKQKLTKAAVPLEAISRAWAREKSIRHSHPSILRLWRARRPSPSPASVAVSLRSGI
jgi:putative DNA methylase